MIKALLMVPLTDNQGQPFSRAHWIRLGEQMTQFSGYSVQENVEGVWVDAGRVYRDRNRAYTVVLTSIRQLPAWVAVVEWALEAFSQEAVYVEVNGAPEIVRKLPT